jgi:demethylmenaquinone methyltransferase/2-methoxy-6-polyprenyl-1,4-benzoquinol methylase
LERKNSRQNLQNTIEMVLGDSENMPFQTIILMPLPFPSELNFETLDKGLAEILHVLKPNGIFVILET